MKYLPEDQLQNRLYQHVRFLTEVSPARNYKNINVLDLVAAYITDHFKQCNAITNVQEFKVEGHGYKNVIAYFGPVEGATIVIGAHYDVAGDQPGADDNASAVAGLLEIASMLGERKDLTYRYELVAYSLEEPPYFGTGHMGSAVHAQFMHERKINLKAMICLEMIGYFSDLPGSQGFPEEAMKKIYPTTGNFIIVVGKEGQEEFTGKVKGLMKQGCSVDVQSINLPSGNYLAGLSDHRNYWKQGYQAVMINDTSFLRNPNYHLRSDTIDTLDFAKMAEVVKGTYHLVTHL